MTAGAGFHRPWSTCFVITTLNPPAPACIPGGSRPPPGTGAQNSGGTDLRRPFGGEGCLPA
jgi:hypothetical protein